MLPWLALTTSWLRRPSRSSMSGSICTQMARATCTRSTAATSSRAAQVSCQDPMMKEFKDSLLNMMVTEMARSRDLSSWNSTRTQVGTSQTLSERTWELITSEAIWRSWVRFKRRVLSRLRKCPGTRSQRTRSTSTSSWLCLIDMTQSHRLLGT
jgi:hypothetical protein